jgi:hypothetical protein
MRRGPGAYRYKGCAARECLGTDFSVAGASLKQKEREKESEIEIEKANCMKGCLH